MSMTPAQWIACQKRREVDLLRAKMAGLASAWEAIAEAHQANEPDVAFAWRCCAERVREVLTDSD